MKFILKSGKAVLSAATAAMMLCSAVSPVLAYNEEIPAVPEPADGFVRYEAEDAVFGGGNKIENQSTCSGGKVVGGMGTKAAKDLLPDFSNTTYVKFTVTNEGAAGVAQITLGYRSSEDNNYSEEDLAAGKVQVCADIPIKANDGTVKTAHVARDDQNVVKRQATVNVALKEGDNTIYVGGPVAGGGWINIDYIDVSATSEDLTEDEGTDVSGNIPSYGMVAEGFTRYEAEDAEFGGGCAVENQGICSGGKAVGGMKTMAVSGLAYDFSNTTYVKFTVVNEHEAGMAHVTVGFRSSEDAGGNPCAPLPIKANDGTVKTVTVARENPDAAHRYETVTLDLEAGENVIYVGGPIAGGGWINIDYIDVENVPDPTQSAEPPEEEVNLDPNPIIKSIYTADPSAHVWSTDPDRLYLYPSHDGYPAVGCDRMDRPHIYSTNDMVNWRDEGEIFGANDLEWGMPKYYEKADGTWEDKEFMWAPDAAYSPKTGLYYYYYPHPADEARQNWAVGVAVSKYPDHGFVDMGTPIYGIGGKSMIDPAVFTDPATGDSYLYLGGGGNEMNGCAVAKLNDDMITLAEEPHIMYMKGMEGRTDVQNGGMPSYHEGPYVFYKDGKYYLMYADGYQNLSRNEDGSIKKGDGYNRQRYLISDSPEGPWTMPEGEDAAESELDTELYGPATNIMLKPGNCETSHGSVVEFKDNWYIFYHNMALSDKGSLRSVSVSNIEFNQDGTIVTREHDPNAVDAVAVSDKESAREASIAANRAVTAYEAEDAVLGGAAEVKDYTGSLLYDVSGGKAVTKLYIPDSFVKFEGVDGGDGGRANIEIKYSSPIRGYAWLNVNGKDYENINIMATGGKSIFKGTSNITVNMKPGIDNVITISGATTNMAIDSIVVTPYNDKTNEAAGLYTTK